MGEVATPAPAAGRRGRRVAAKRLRFVESLASTRFALPVLVVVQDFRYERRQPERTTLYQVVQGNLETLQAASEEGLSSALPSFVRSELEGYLECGLLCRGFAVMACTDPECKARHLVAFSCYPERETIRSRVP